MKGVFWPTWYLQRISSTALKRIDAMVILALRWLIIISNITVFVIIQTKIGLKETLGQQIHILNPLPQDKPRANQDSSPSKWSMNRVKYWCFSSSLVLSKGMGPLKKSLFAISQNWSFTTKYRAQNSRDGVISRFEVAGPTSRQDHL